MNISLLDGASAPTRGSEFACGYDLSSSVDITIPARSQEAVETGLAVELPSGHFGWIASRSGLAKKKGMFVMGGIIDEDYRGTMKVILGNHSDQDFEVKKGDRVAQLIIMQYCTAKFKVVDTLSETKRGSEGLGSTGVSADSKKQKTE